MSVKLLLENWRTWSKKGSKKGAHTGTAKAKAQFQVQFEAVANETALALILAGKISEG
jgi:hypothetical protein